MAFSSKPSTYYKTIVFLLILTGSFALFSFFKMADPDLWGHIKFGKEIIASGEIPTCDQYSYVAKNLPWINHEWLSEIIFYYLYEFFGSTGLVLFKTIIGLIITYILWRINLLRINHPWETIPIPLMLSASVITFGFAIRPQVFTYLFFTVYLYLLYLFKNRNADRLFLIPLIMVFWVNLHGGFLAGIGLLIIYITAGLISQTPFLKSKFKTSTDSYKLKKMTIILIITILTTLLNPYSFNLWIFLLKTLSKSRPYIWEWLPVNLNILYIDYGFLALLTIVIILSSKARTTLINLSLLIITLFLSIKQVRHIPFFAITTACIIPYHLEHLVKNKIGVALARLRKMNVIFLLALIPILIICQPLEKPQDFLQIQVAGNRYPVRTVKFLKDNGFKGNLLVDFDWGEYCIWKLYPDFKVCVDGRYKTVYPPEIIDKYFSFLYGEKGWNEFLNEYPHDWILISKYKPAARLMKERKDWLVLFSLKDSPAVLMVKTKSDAHRQLVEKMRTKKLIPADSTASNRFP